MRSAGATSRAGLFKSSPLTETRPASIQRSASRREHSPARPSPLAIRQACAAQGSERLDGADIYVTLEPCPMCASAISFARIRRLYWGAGDPKGGGVEHGARIFSQPTCHHAPELYGGIEEMRAAALLRDFFARRR